MGKAPKFVGKVVGKAQKLVGKAQKFVGKARSHPNFCMKILYGFLMLWDSLVGGCYIRAENLLDPELLNPKP